MKTVHEKQQLKIRNLIKTQTQTNTPTTNKNYPRVISTTEVQFTQNEMQLLGKGLQYNLYYKQKTG
jgi:hypothetical protein